MKITILHEDCDKELSKDTSLPYTTYLVEYKLDGTVRYDVVNCKKMIDIFDHYWDHYRHDFINLTQTEGRIDPRLYGFKSNPNKPSNKK